MGYEVGAHPRSLTEMQRLPIKLLSLVPVILLALAGSAAPRALKAENIQLPNIGDSAATVVSPTQERRTGEAVVRNIRRLNGMIEDPQVNEYINHLGYRLVSESTGQLRDYHFFIVNDGGINAFALPGGFIGINYGLFLKSGSESELAAVLAHEIAHVSQRHHARAYEVASDSNIPVLAALIAAIVLGSQDNQIGQAAMASIAAGTIQKQIDFTRNNEKEADRIGIGLLAAAGFDPHTMSKFFEHLQQESRLYGLQAPEFLRTHPVNESRIADARNRASQYPHQQIQVQKAFHLVRARLRVLTSKNPTKTLKRFKQNLASGSYLDRDAENYGYVLSLLENRQPKTAQQKLKPLLKKEPDRIAYLLAKAQIASQRKQYHKALTTYQNALLLYPSNASLTRHYAQTLIQANKPQLAQKLLLKYLRTPPEDPSFYRLLSEAEAKLGNNTASHEAMGEYYYRSGQTHQAITQLSLALKKKNIGFYRVSRIEARLAELKQETALLNNTHEKHSH